MLPTSEALTEQFYAWEKRGRGWQLFEYPVPLEPPFRPFFGHYVVSRPVADDARHPTLLSSITNSLFGSNSKLNVSPADMWIEEPEPTPEPFVYEYPLVEIGMALPADLKVSRERAVQILARLANRHSPVSFEIIGVQNSIFIQFACSLPDRAQACEQIQGYFPEVRVQDRPEFLASAWRATGPALAIVDFGLSREFMIPIRAGKDFEIDPLIPVVAALSGVGEGELGILQVVFESTRNGWADSILRAVTDNEGKAFFPDAPELVSLARGKVSQSLVAAVLRVAVRAKTERRAWDVARNIGAGLCQFADPLSNELMPLSNDDYPDHVHAEDVLERKSHRSGMLLNVHELVSLVHVPRPQSNRRNSGMP